MRIDLAYIKVYFSPYTEMRGFDIRLKNCCYLRRDVRNYDAAWSALDFFRLVSLASTH